MPVTVSSTNRDSKAIAALRSVVTGITNIWAVQQHNDLTAASVDAETGYIVETPLGGRVATETIGSGVPVRSFTRQWSLLLKAPVGSGLDVIAQANAIEQALRAAAITITDSGSDSPVTVQVLDVQTMGTRDPSGIESHTTTPLIVQYRFLSAN